jgi:hypothetical protein
MHMKELDQIVGENFRRLFGIGPEGLPESSRVA